MLRIECFSKSFRRHELQEIILKDWIGIESRKLKNGWTLNYQPCTFLFFDLLVRLMVSSESQWMDRQLTALWSKAFRDSKETGVARTKNGPWKRIGCTISWALTHTICAWPVNQIDTCEIAQVILRKNIKKGRFGERWGHMGNCTWKWGLCAKVYPIQRFE